MESSLEGSGSYLSEVITNGAYLSFTVTSETSPGQFSNCFNCFWISSVEDIEEQLLKPGRVTESHKVNCANG